MISLFEKLIVNSYLYVHTYFIKLALLPLKKLSKTQEQVHFVEILFFLIIIGCIFIFKIPYLFFYIYGISIFPYILIMFQSTSEIPFLVKLGELIINIYKYLIYFPLLFLHELSHYIMNIIVNLIYVIYKQIKCKKLWRILYYFRISIKEIRFTKMEINIKRHGDNGVDYKYHGQIQSRTYNNISAKLVTIAPLFMTILLLYLTYEHKFFFYMILCHLHLIFLSVPDVKELFNLNKNDDKDKTEIQTNNNT